MVKNAIIACLVAISFMNKGSAQPIVKKGKYRTVTVDRHPMQTWPLTVSFYSPVFFHSGLSVQTDYVLSEKSKLINRRRLLRYAGLHPKDRFREKNSYQLLQPGFIIYNQKDFHTGISANLLYKKRWVRYKGFSYDVGGSLGLLSTIYNDKTYVIKKDGEIKERGLAGRWYLTPTVTLGIGYDFAKSKNHRNAGAIQIQSIVAFPFPLNSSTGFLGYWQVGYRFRIESYTNFMNKLKK